MTKKDHLTKEEQEMLEHLVEEYGKTEEEILEEYEQAQKLIRYVKFVKGSEKGRVGFYFKVGWGEYAINIFTKDEEIWCPNFRTETVEITKEEYEEEVKKWKGAE